MPHDGRKVHRMFELVEPIATIAFSDGVTEAFQAVGLREYWDGYFAGRAAPLGTAPAEVVDAVFYNFAPGEVARHIPWVWTKIAPEQAFTIREQSSATALQERIGPIAESADLARAADLLTKAAASAPSDGLPLYAGLLAVDAPPEPVARLWHAATLVREHRGQSHNCVLVARGIGRTECHVLLAVRWGERPEDFSRLQHLPPSQIAAAVDGLRRRGLVDADTQFTESGRDLSDQIETRTDELAAVAYEALTADELDELITLLEPIAAAD